MCRWSSLDDEYLAHERARIAQCLPPTLSATVKAPCPQRIDCESTNRVKSGRALKWLLDEKGEPSIRYLALTELMGKSEQDADVRAAKERIPLEGWGADILSKEMAGGWWVSGESLYRPKYLSTNWMLLVLSDLGLTKSDARIAEACELWIDRLGKEDGGFGLDGSKKGHLCITGNCAQALVRFGYSDHPHVRSAFEWMVKNSAAKGGWSCFGSGRNLDSWEPMSAFAVYPRQKWTKSMLVAVEKAAEYYLEKELHMQGSHYEPWYRFHYPVHYYYDLLVGLDFMTALGYGGDKRLGHAVAELMKKQRPDGAWNLDAVHPDLDGAAAEWYRANPKHAPTPFALEKAGEPSKMVTLKALTVLKRLGE